MAPTAPQTVASSPAASSRKAAGDDFTEAELKAVGVAKPPKTSPPARAPALRASGESASRKRLASLALGGASDEPMDRVVYVPVFVNKGALAEGEVVKVQKPAVKAKAKVSRAISVGQLAKRARHS